MNYFSICSGIEAASAAWHQLGWRPIGFSEIEPFPCAVLNHRYPEVKNYGDMTKYKEWQINDTIDLLVGGTPCQAFSIAGLRKGLADPRGNLTLTFLGMVEHFHPRWVVWENVPGVLSDRTGAFGSFLGGLSELGYGWAYRIMDARFFGVPQRRRRVFVVAYLGEWQRAAAVLFEPESLRRHPAPREKEKERNPGLFPCLTRRGPGCLREEEGFIIEPSGRIRHAIPIECERLQGFPDDYTRIPYKNKPSDQCPDGPRYKALGNSMAVPCMAWIGKRIARVNAIP